MAFAKSGGKCAGRCVLEAGNHADIVKSRVAKAQLHAGLV
jgi:hypothetical protein